MATGRRLSPRPNGSATIRAEYTHADAIRRPRDAPATPSGVTCIGHEARRAIVRLLPKPPVPRWPDRYEPPGGWPYRVRYLDSSFRRRVRKARPRSSATKSGGSETRLGDERGVRHRRGFPIDGSGEMIDVEHVHGQCAGARQMAQRTLIALHEVPTRVGAFAPFVLPGFCYRDRCLEVRGHRLLRAGLDCSCLLRRTARIDPVTERHTAASPGPGRK